MRIPAHISNHFMANIHSKSMYAVHIRHVRTLRISYIYAWACLMDVTHCMKPVANNILKKKAWICTSYSQGASRADHETPASCPFVPRDLRLEDFLGFEFLPCALYSCPEHNPINCFCRLCIYNPTCSGSR